MKLELKHLANYLPYGVKLTDAHENKYNLCYMSTKKISVIDVNGFGEQQKLSWSNASRKIFPVLKPLSELKDEMLLELRKGEGNSMLLWGLENKRDEDFVYFYEEDLTYTVLCWLFENHFDVFQLIDKGLAKPQE